ncbi:DUF4349 domain-containing protein [Nonlabens sp. YIK11]|uniref:DUF4349 domain-containing protein n=1 Tax=Nonlabens sp. YIK11 TaxID=1453349 RepID=UPI000A961326|nr:DUF4349 domain-containing protein [Nonlabens sp. YIK11]
MMTARIFKISFLLLFIAASFTACNENPNAEMVENVDMFPMLEPEQEAVEITDRKLITNGRIEFETNDISQTRNNIITAVNKHRGYIAADEESSSTGRKTNTITIRVPSKNFDNLLSDATAGVDRLDYKTINVKDVTEEFLDVEARLKTKKELEGRYLEILEQAKNVTDILEIERQIAVLRSDIESFEGRLKYLENQVSYSTLHISFYESTPELSYNKNRFSESFANGWDNLVWFFIGLINIWPFIIVLIALVILFRYLRRRRRIRKRLRD